MSALSYLKDRDFLRALDNSTNKFYWVKIEVLDSNELPIQSIEGRVQPGSTLNIDGSSSVRRTCNISFIAEEKENDLSDIENLLSINKKIRIFEGIKNEVDSYYDDVIWFPLGVFVIIQPSISNTGSGGCIINLSCKDKMCLLNGECAGGLPTSVTFHAYDQIIGLRKVDSDPRKDSSLTPNNYTIYKYNDKYYSWTAEYGWKEEIDDSQVGTRISVPQRFYDIIQTLVCNYGGESLSKIFINDVPLEIKQIVRYVGSGLLHFNTATGLYTTDEDYLTETASGEEDTWRHFSYNEDVGYVYTDFVYPGELISNIGDNVGSVLERIKNTLGNYEYFYDVYGNFVFQEVKNYLNTSYQSILKDKDINNLNSLSILNDENYKADFYSNTRSVYTFEEGNGIIISYNNSPNYTNIKNDFHIWGENDDGYAIHYHMAIKNKPTNWKNKIYPVVYLTDNMGEYTGGIRLATDEEWNPTAGIQDPNVVQYTPADWRAELYLQGLESWAKEQRPDVYQQELLDLFDSIYDFKKKDFKADLVTKPNDLQYFFDYLDPVSKLYDCSVDTLKPKVYSYKQEHMNRLYNTDIPNIIMIDLDMDDVARQAIIDRCESEGQPYSNIDPKVYASVAIGTIGYTAQEVARDLLYQYTNYNENINIQSIPIYYLDVNSRITVKDRKSGIYGDYIIKSISLPLDAGNTMTISATRAMERI